MFSPNEPILFLGFFTSWIRIRIQEAFIYADPCGSGCGSETLVGRYLYLIQCCGARAACNRHFKGGAGADFLLAGAESRSRPKKWRLRNTDLIRQGLPRVYIGAQVEYFRFRHTEQDDDMKNIRINLSYHILSYKK